MVVLFSRPFSVSSGIQPVRQCRTSPRCIVLTLAITFIAFNWLVLHAARSSPPETNMFSSQQGSTAGASDPDKNQGSTLPPQRHTPKLLSPPSPWFGDWIRWRALDPSLTHDMLVPPEKRSLDLVYAWVNGSDPSLDTLRTYHQTQSPVFRNADSKQVAEVTTKRFRDMDELRYSLRSVLQYATDAVRNIYVMVSPIANDSSSPLSSSRSQKPEWYDPTSGHPRPLHLVSHADFFVHKDHLPSFNSLSIEANMANIPGVASNFIYLNDDIFLGRPLNVADFWTPLYGYVLHMEGSLRVPPQVREIPLNPFNIGEWHSLQFTNVLLSEQFGARDRAYVAHIVHLFNKDILDEIQQLWPRETFETSSHRFRGEGEAKDIHTSFLFAHYVIERLRQVQLESFWKNTVDTNADGELELRERQWLIERIKEWNGGDPAIFRSWRNHLTNHKDILNRFSMTLTGTTDYRLSGMDGFPYILNNADTSKSILAKGVEQKPYFSYEPHATRQCKIDIDFCLGGDFADPSLPTISSSRSVAIFQRLFKEEFHCGDCLLEMVMHHRDLGMRVVLPADETSAEYKRVIRDLERYQYVLGTSPYVFMALQAPDSAQKNLDSLWDHRANLAFMCINDDFKNEPKVAQKIQHQLQSFLNKRYPVAAPWEKYPPVEIEAPTD